MDKKTRSPNHLKGPRLRWARILWIASVVLMLGLWLAGLGVILSEPVPNCLEAVCDPFDFNSGDIQIAQDLDLIPVVPFTYFSLFGSILNAAIYFFIAGIIFWRKANDWFALHTSFLLVYLGARFFTSFDDALLRGYPQIQPISDFIFYSGLALLMAYFFLFPDGRFVPKRLKWVVVLSIIGVIISDLFSTMLSIPLGSNLFPIFVIFAMSAQIYRYFRISTAEQKQQSKWVLMGLIGTIFAMIIWGWVSIFYPPDQPSSARIFSLLIAVPLTILFNSLLPVSIAFSIFRYKLWDIDLVIRRTLTYSLLSVILAMIYFGSVIFLQTIFANFFGRSSALVTVISTLLIAALFNPLRRRLQHTIDRRFSRRKYIPSEVLNTFAATTRDEADLRKISSQLIKTIQKSIEPEAVSLWMLEKSRSKSIEE